MWVVYFLKSAHKNWYYVGSTDNIVRRLAEHNSGKVQSTKVHIPLQVVYEREFADEHSARAFEHKVKKQRLLKEEIVRNIKNTWEIV